MTSNYEFHLTTAPSFALSFYADMGKTSWIRNGEQMDKGIEKTMLPHNALFNISSLVFNIETRKEEVLSHFSCFYNPSLEAFCIVFDEGSKTSTFSRDAMMNLMDFAKKLSIKSIVLLINRKSQEYAKLVQGMMLVGFAPDKTKKMAMIEGQNYRVLTMNINEQSESIEEVDF